MQINLTVGVLALATTGSVLALAAPAEATPSGHSYPVIERATAYDAPVGRPGGISAPFASCANARVVPTMHAVIERPGTDIRYTENWKSWGPNMWFPRVPVGDYRVTTTATCPVHQATRVQTVSVKQKTARTTISRAEFRRIKHGMTLRRIQHIVGYAG